MPAPKYATTAAELMTLDEISAMSGLEFLQGIVDGKLPAPPISKTLGFRLHAVEEGSARFRGVPAFEYCNPLGTVHGGWYGTLLDSAMACAVQAKLPKGVIYTTLEFKINITRPVPLGEEVECIGRVSHFGRTTGVAEGRIVGVENGKLYATGSTTCIVIPR